MARVRPEKQAFNEEKLRSDEVGYAKLFDRINKDVKSCLVLFFIKMARKFLEKFMTEILSQDMNSISPQEYDVLADTLSNLEFAEGYITINILDQ